MLKRLEVVREGGIGNGVLGCMWKGEGSLVIWQMGDGQCCLVRLFGKAAKRAWNQARFSIGTGGRLRLLYCSPVIAMRTFAVFS